MSEVDFGKQFDHKKILVTGGCGSIGSEIVRALLKCNPSVVRIFDNAETELFNLQTELKKFDNVRFLVGDVRDKDRVARAMEDIDFVFHVAALKHVALSEYNPFEAVKTNVLGTQNIIENALNEEVEKFVNVSTDKAANAIGAMGASKLLAEKLTTAADFYKGARKTIFLSVRFGNVFGSRGSLAPIFNSQIKKGQPITVTDTRMTRFFMSIPQAVQMIFKSANMAIGGEIFILKMPAIRINDLAQIMIDELAPKYAQDRNKIQIKIVGKRAGERTHEYLMSEDETKHAVETEDLFIIVPESPKESETKKYIYQGARPVTVSSFTSEHARPLTRSEIKEMLANIEFD